MSAIFDEEGNPRYFGFYRGFVVDNADPEKMGRVTVMVPGLLEPESGWAWPFAMGGPPQNGVWDVPKANAPVHVIFHQGDIDEPHWVHGWYARDHAPTPVLEASAADAVNHIKAFETDRHLVVLDSLKNQVLVKDKVSGTLIAMSGDKIELGGEGLTAEANGIVIASTPCQFSGSPHFVSGPSRTVRAKD